MTSVTKRVPIPARGVDYRGKIVLGEPAPRLLGNHVIDLEMLSTYGSVW